MAWAAGSVHCICDSIPAFFGAGSGAWRASIVVDAGDFGTYAAVASWLMSHPITQPADMGAGYNPLQPHVYQHQATSLRLGALFLLAFSAVISGREVVEFYSAFAALCVGLQSLSVYLNPNFPDGLSGLRGLQAFPALSAKCPREDSGRQRLAMANMEPLCSTNCEAAWQFG